MRTLHEILHGSREKDAAGFPGRKEGRKGGRKESSSKPKCAEFSEDKVWTAKDEPIFQRDLKEFRKL